MRAEGVCLPGLLRRPLTSVLGGPWLGSPPAVGLQTTVGWALSPVWGAEGLMAVGTPACGFCVLLLSLTIPVVTRRLAPSRLDHADACLLGCWGALLPKPG